MSVTEIIFVALALIFLTSTIYFAYQLYNAKMQLAKMATIEQTEPIMLDRFRAIAAQALEGSSQTFLQLAAKTFEKDAAEAQHELEKKKNEIDQIVDPLRKKLDEYQQHLLTVERERTKSYLHVEEELKRVAEHSSQLSKETSALKNALKKPHVRGRWGEVQLKNCVELAGMSEYSDVTFQDNTVIDDGTRLIPDMTVKMPGGRIVIVDAKTPIDAFIASLEAQDDETRAIELARHGKHVKEHIKKLSVKSYSDNLKMSADFTVLFLPNESFLYAALETEPDIMEFALQRKILIATPPTLVGLLKVVRFGWNEERLAENAQKISEVGAELHKRLADFTESFVGIGRHLDKAKAEYDAGLTRLQSRVLTQAKRLEQLGAKSTKSLPEEATRSIELIDS